MRRRGRDACSPATARRWKLAAMDCESQFLGITQTTVPPYLLKGKDEIIADLRRAFDEIEKMTPDEEDPRAWRAIAMPLGWRPSLIMAVGL